MTDNVTIIGTLEGFKKSVADRLIKCFIETYPTIEAEIYLGYPIYIDEVSMRKVSVDIAIISRIGVFFINILEAPIIDYGKLQDEIYIKVESKFKKQPFLVKRRALVFKFETITYYEGSMEAQDDYFLANSIEDLITIIDKNKEKKIEEQYSNDLYCKILSGIQEAYGFNNHQLREGVVSGTKAYAINEMASKVEKYGNSQMEAILSDVDGIQRIRGMAGSGKTIVLARKAVELHTAHPDWDIVVTYSTRSLKDQLENLISNSMPQKMKVQSIIIKS